MQHHEVGGLADLVDEPGQGDAREAGQRLLPGEAVPDLPRGDAHAPRAVVGIVDDEVLLHHRVEHVVSRGAWQIDGVRDADG